MKPSGSTETNPRFGASTPKSAKVIGMLPATCPLPSLSTASSSTLTFRVTPAIVRSPVAVSVCTSPTTGVPAAVTGPVRVKVASGYSEARSAMSRK